MHRLIISKTAKKRMAYQSDYSMLEITENEAIWATIVIRGTQIYLTRGSSVFKESTYIIKHIV
jgi:hypothetical protein